MQHISRALDELHPYTERQLPVEIILECRSVKVYLVTWKNGIKIEYKNKALTANNKHNNNEVSFSETPLIN